MHHGLPSLGLNPHAALLPEVLRCNTTYVIINFAEVLFDQELTIRGQTNITEFFL